MIDYKLLEALAMVVQEQGFEKAAEKLFITQSAVSQRIRSLEDQVGSIVITRTSPPIPTEVGKRLVRHCRQVMRLEEELAEASPAEENPLFTTVPVGVNMDSLELWFLPAVRDLLFEEHILLDIHMDDQDQTREFLRDGTVSGTISSSSRRLQGCSVHRLGVMEYQLICTPAFRSRWFPEGFTREAVRQAPAVIFNRSDTLLDRQLDEYYSVSGVAYQAHYVPSTVQFLSMITEGLAYGMTPVIQCRDLLDEGIVIPLVGKPMAVDLYWHCWNIASESLAAVTDAVILGGKQYLS